MSEYKLREPCLCGDVECAECHGPSFIEEDPDDYYDRVLQNELDEELHRE